MTDELIKNGAGNTLIGWEHESSSVSGGIVILSDGYIKQKFKFDDNEEFVLKLNATTLGDGVSVNVSVKYKENGSEYLFFVIRKSGINEYDFRLKGEVEEAYLLITGMATVKDISVKAKGLTKNQVNMVGSEIESRQEPLTTYIMNASDNENGQCRVNNVTYAWKYNEDGFVTEISDDKGGCLEVANHSDAYQSEVYNAILLATVFSKGLRSAIEPLSFIIEVDSGELFFFDFYSLGERKQRYTVDWGDGIVSEIVYPPYDVDPNAYQHRYTVGGEYTITIQNYEYGHMMPGSIDNLKEIRGSLPRIVADNDTDFSRYFQSAGKYPARVKVSEIIFANNPQIEILYECFNRIDFPEFTGKLLSRLTNLKNVSHAFYECNIPWIPEGFFKSCSLLENLSYCFMYDLIEKIPPKLFTHIRSEECNIEHIVYNSPLKEVGDDMFNGCTALLDVKGNCPWWSDQMGIKRIGNRIFYKCKFKSNLPNLYSTSNDAVYGDEIYAYAEGTSPTNIGTPVKVGNGMFLGAKIKGESGLSPILGGGSNLEEIGDYTFKDCDCVSFYATFAGTRLKKIGRGTFINSTATSYRFIFAATQIEEIPPDTFDDCINANSFEGCFYECTSLRGNAPKLWEMYPNANGNQCFYGCVNLDNYDEIPADWK